MSDQPATQPQPKYIVEVIGELPYFIPIPANAIFAPTLIGAEAFKLWFQHFQPPPPPGYSQSENIDDHRGTFIKSQSHIQFPRSGTPSDDERDRYIRKALELTNKAILAVRYIASEPAMLHVEQFQQAALRVWQLESGGTALSEGVQSHQVNLGPFGASAARILSVEALGLAASIFNGLTPINPAHLLVLDSKYHNTVGDISRAILDLGTALEIHVPRLIGIYSSLARHLSEIDIEDGGIYRLYDNVLKQATGHTLHERQDLFVKLEYIRGLRNSITHRWKPEFRVTPEMKKSPRYLSTHQQYDGHIVTTSSEVDGLISDADRIIQYVTRQFEDAYGKL